MSRIHRIAIITALATGVCAPNALAAPTAKLETSAKPVFNQGYYVTPANTKVFFNAAHSTAGGFYRRITKVEMDLNGNGIYDYTSTDPIPSGSWTFQGPGRYVTIKLRVTNNFGQTDEDSLTLRINTPPSATLAVPDRPVITGDPVLLDASTSTDDEAGLNYAFDPEGDGTFLPWQSTPTLQHIYTQPGGYVVAAKVMDRFGLESNVSMRGLQVNAPDTTAPLMRFVTTTSTLAGKLAAFTVECPAEEIRCTGTFSLAPVGNAKFSPATFDVAGGAQQTVTVTANKKARKRIKRRGSLTTIATATATDAAGNTGTTTIPVTVSR
jgi:hypothetical protein